VAAVSKKPDKANLIENMTLKTTQTAQVQRNKTTALETRYHPVLGRSQVNYTMLFSEERKSGKLTIRLLYMANAQSVPEHNGVTTRTPAAPKEIIVPNASVFSELKNRPEYTELHYIRACPTILRKILRHELPMIIDGGSEFCLKSDEVAGELNVGWKPADRKTISADSNRSDLLKVALSVAVRVHGIIILV
jgi:hypothetical protein